MRRDDGGKLEGLDVVRVFVGVSVDGERICEGGGGIGG